MAGRKSDALKLAEILIAYFEDTFGKNSSLPALAALRDFVSEKGE